MTTTGPKLCSAFRQLFPRRAHTPAALCCASLLLLLPLGDPDEAAHIQRTSSELGQPVFLICFSSFGRSNASKWRITPRQSDPLSLRPRYREIGMRMSFGATSQMVVWAFFKVLCGGG